MKWENEKGTMETFEGSEGWASCFATDGGLLQTDKAAGSFDKGSLSLSLPPNLRLSSTHPLSIIKSLPLLHIYHKHTKINYRVHQ